MKRSKKHPQFVLRRIERDGTSQRFEHEKSKVILENMSGRKEAEFLARKASRDFPRDLITLARNGTIISHLINGRSVEPLALVAGANAIYPGPMTLPEANKLAESALRASNGAWLRIQLRAHGETGGALVVDELSIASLRGPTP